MNYQDLQSFLAQNDEWQSCPDLVVDPPTQEELTEKFGMVDDQVLSRCDEWITSHVTRGAQYWMMRMRGSNDSFAAMISLQQGPGLDTDDVFFSGQKPLYDQFGSQKHLDRYLKASKAQGFTPPVNSTYFPNLARFPGDKEAYVTRAQGRSYIKKLCESRGWACEGGVNVAHRQPESDPYAKENCVPLGEDFIREREAKALRENPKVDRRELRERIIEKHGSSI